MVRMIYNTPNLGVQNSRLLTKNQKYNSFKIVNPEIKKIRLQAHINMVNGYVQ